MRLGWTIVPEGLKFADGSKVRDDFNRVMTTAFNGASNLAQPGGLACLDDEGLEEIETLIECVPPRGRRRRRASVAAVRGVVSCRRRRGVASRRRRRRRHECAQPSRASSDAIARASSRRDRAAERDRVPLGRRGDTTT